LDANINDESRRRYASAVTAFLQFVQSWGERLESSDDMDYWLAMYAHHAHASNLASRGQVEKALAGLEHWLPEVKPLRLSRRCLRGWHRLEPPQPAAPIPRDLAFSCAALAALRGYVDCAIAMLLAYDAWMRISEVAGLRARDVVDSRAQHDPVGQCVAVYLPTAKTGRRQAVAIACPETATLVAAWAAARLQLAGPNALLFPDQPALRAGLAASLAAFPDVEARGLHFTWHSFRHGGASRAFRAGMLLADIMTRGRWAATTSAQHYLQAGRQLLLGIALPAEASELARRLHRVGLVAVLAADFREQLEQ